MIAEMRKLVNALKNIKGAPEISIEMVVFHSDEQENITLNTKWFSNVEGIKFCGSLLKELTSMSDFEGKEFTQNIETNFPLLFSMMDEKNKNIFTKQNTYFPNLVKMKYITIINNGKENVIKISDKVVKKAGKLNPIAKQVMKKFGLN